MDDDNDDDAELNELIVENTKLKHRLAVLNKVRDPTQPVLRSR